MSNYAKLCCFPRVDFILPQCYSTEQRSCLKLHVHECFTLLQGINMRKINNKSRNLFGYVMGIALIFFFIVVITTFGFLFYRKLKSTTFKEKQEHLIDINDKSMLVVDELVNAAWDRLYTCEILMQRSKPQNEKELYEVLGSMFGYINLSDIMTIAIDDAGNYYTSNGEKSHFNEPSMIAEGTPARQSTIMNLSLYGRQDEDSLLLIERLDEAIVYDDVRINYLGLAVDMKALSDTFTINDLHDDSAIYVVDEEGMKIYGNYDVNLIPEDNVLQAIGSLSFRQGGDYDDFLQDFYLEKNNAYEVMIGKKSYYTFVSHIDSADWYIIMFVPTDLLGNNIEIILKNTLTYFLMVSVLIILICAIVVAMIITERNSRLFAIREHEARQELEEVNDKLEVATQAAISANNAKSEFLTHMSHDIRTPINGIMCMTDIALKHPEDSRRMTYCLGKISESSQHLLSLVNDVLDLSRIESGKMVVVSDPMNMREVCAYSASIISGQLNMRDLEFITEFGDFKHSDVLGDALHLRQVLINILGNSIKFTPDGGRIIFRVHEKSCTDDAVVYRFEVEDTGIGMKKEFLPHVFESFAQEYDATCTGYTGTGLGMAITKKFVDMMNGTISVESEYQVGTRIVIEIPYEIDKEERKSRALDPGEISLEGMKVLVVDDNELNLEIATLELEEENAVVTTATNGKLAVEEVLGKPPGTFDIILMDIMMPVMDGLTATRKIRESGREDLKAIPIIAFSANAYYNDIKRAEEAGMNAFLPKPIKPDIVKSTLSSFRKKDTDKIASLENMRVLLVEDNEINAIVERDYLEDEKAIVTLAVNGRDAVDKFEESSIGYFDFILMDVKMPVMDGMEAARQIRALDRNDAGLVPILAMTADTYRDEEEKSRQSGMDAYLVKPLDVGQLIAELNKIKQ